MNQRSTRQVDQRLHKNTNKKINETNNSQISQMMYVEIIQEKRQCHLLFPSEFLKFSINLQVFLSFDKQKELTFVNGQNFIRIPEKISFN